MAFEIYCTQSDLEARYTAERVAEVFSVQDADGATSGTASGAAVVTACTDASAKVASYLIGVHSDAMNFGSVPELVKYHACAIAMYLGMRRRPEIGAMKAETVPYYRDAQDAVAELKLIREGILRVSKDLKPANAGGSVASQLPTELQPSGTFITDPTTGNGGFEGGTF